MTEIINLILENNSIFIVFFAFIDFVITDVLKKVIPSSIHLKTGLIPFIIGILSYSIFGFFALSEQNLLSLFEQGIQVGGLATLFYAVSEQIVKEGGLKKSVTDILKGILSSTTLHSVVSEIIEGYSKDNTPEQNHQVILMLLIKNTSMSQEECKTITDIIIKTLTNNV